MIVFSYYALHILPLSPQILWEIRLGRFEIFDIFIIGYFGLVFDLADKTGKNSCIYVLSLQYLSSL